MNRDEEKIVLYTERFISQIEKEELLKAPPDMKNNIMERVRHQEVKEHSQTTVSISRLQLFMYSMKVGVVAAMALIALFAIDQDKFANVSESEWQSKVVIQMNEKTNMINDGLTAISNQLVKTEGFNNEKKEK